MKNFTNQTIENLKKEKYTHVLKTVFRAADVADMQLISKFNKELKIVLCVIDIYSKYA